MFKRLIMVAGMTQAEFARKIGIIPQVLTSKLKSQTIAMLFLILKTLDAKLYVEYKDGTRVDLMQFSDEFEFTKRPYARSCKEA